MPRLVLGSRNKKKLRELVELLSDLVEVVDLSPFPNAPADIEETGTTFEENARIKATTLAPLLGEWTLGEDSGLVVPALGGQPGVYSARFSDPGATDERNNALLLEKLVATPLDSRWAHYTCYASLSDPHGHIKAESVGTCRGRILTTPAGSGGFGYDPLFEIVECHRTFGELAPAVKRVLSHRSRAMRQLIPQLLAVM